MPYRPSRISAGSPYPVFDLRDQAIDHQPHVITHQQLNNTGVIHKLSLIHI